MKSPYQVVSIARQFLCSVGRCGGEKLLVQQADYEPERKIVEPDYTLIVELGIAVIPRTGMVVL